MKRSVYAGVNFAVVEIDPEANGGDPGVLLQFYDKDSGELIDFPMSPDDAEAMADKLRNPEAPKAAPVTEVESAPQTAPPARSADPVPPRD
jgi:hypothetical protein